MSVTTKISRISHAEQTRRQDLIQRDFFAELMKIHIRLIGHIQQFLQNFRQSW
ncbi:Uncharacterised protein [Vibrio cholerae]|uniref:Uncharacterized protein n=1 Tax=Vibrio cholerae TaxID=666 RepID=A0A655S2J8_VIBCL|nr:Uncharacterised protein [Vibrio cholerae]CSB56897.1 Uncharacterised protein [Vibrio cholerae]CSC07123.1 Uncharacterised protein [Vibrio cholerae]